jgi:glycosyltransferase involved in cell wall biosynthesis
MVSYPHTLTIFTPSKSTINTTFTECILRILTSNIVDLIKMKVDFYPSHGMSNIVHARSIALTNWYDISKDGDLFLFIDSDHVFTKEDIVNLVNLKNCDVSCGIYCKSSGDPNAYPVDLNAFLDNYRDNRLLYAGTGFMLIHRPICTRLVNLIKQLDGEEGRFCINADNPNNTIPFFRTRIVNSENNLQPVDVKHWLGEDYSFCWLVRQCGGTIRGFISNTLGHEVSTIKNFFPNNFKANTWPIGSIVYICGNSPIRFDPTEKYHGGSEKVVIQLCKRWVKNPMVTSVTVFGNVNEGNYDGVEYKTFDKLDLADQFDTVILWRNFGIKQISSIKANNVLVDYHDYVNNDEQLKIVSALAKKVFVKSMYHRDQVIHTVKNACIEVIPNGVEEDVFDAIKRNPITYRNSKRFIYASSYERGLEKILKYCWPYIRKNIPDAELHCFYGMQISSPVLKNKINKLFTETDGVYDHGRVDISEIIKEKQKSSFHIYLTDCPSEIDCISVRESALLGCIPLITHENVFNERIGKFFKMDRQNNEIESYKDIANDIVKMINDEKYTEDIRKEIQAEALKVESSWDTVAGEWIKRIISV